MCRWVSFLNPTYFSHSLLENCTVDMTPRFCQKFRISAGEKFRWRNKSVADSRVVQNGTVKADKYGLVTLKQLRVTKGKNRVSITRDSSP